MAMKRKYEVCQKCGSPLTDEHPWAKYCKVCNPKAMKAVIKPQGANSKSGERVMDAREYDVRFLDYGLGVKCFDCGREVDIVSHKSQVHEMKCAGCGKMYRPEFRVIEILPKKD